MVYEHWCIVFRLRYPCSIRFSRVWACCCFRRSVLGHRYAFLIFNAIFLVSEYVFSTRNQRTWFGSWIVTLECHKLFNWVVYRKIWTVRIKSQITQKRRSECYWSLRHASGVHNLHSTFKYVITIVLEVLSYPLWRKFQGQINKLQQLTASIPTLKRTTLLLHTSQNLSVRMVHQIRLPLKRSHKRNGISSQEIQKEYCKFRAKSPEAFLMVGWLCAKRNLNTNTEFYRGTSLWAFRHNDMNT